MLKLEIGAGTLELGMFEKLEILVVKLFPGAAL